MFRLFIYSARCRQGKHAFDAEALRYAPLPVIGISEYHACRRMEEECDRFENGCLSRIAPSEDDVNARFGIPFERFNSAKPFDFQTVDSGRVDRGGISHGIIHESRLCDVGNGVVGLLTEAQRANLTVGGVR